MNDDATFFMQDQVRNRVADITSHPWRLRARGWLGKPELPFAVVAALYLALSALSSLS
jgi:hypothetical protein